MNVVKYINKETIHVMICSFVLVIFTALTVINSSMMDNYTRKEEKSDLYIEWYKLMIDESHQMLDIKQEKGADFSITTKYIFHSSKEKIIEKYNRLLQSEGWTRDYNCNGYVFKKNKFVFYIVFVENMCEIHIIKN